MPRPYSTDLCERTLLACARDGENCIAVARRFRVGISTLHLWRKQAREDGRRTPLRMGRGPAPLGGKLAVLGQIAAEHRDATLAECAELLAQRTGEPKRSTTVICRALRRLGWAQARLCPGCASKDAPGRRAGPRGRGSRPSRMA